MIYAFKHNNGEVIAAIVLDNGKGIPQGFESISSKEYESVSSLLKAGVAVDWNAQLREFTNSTTRSATLQEARVRQDQLARLRLISNEIALYERLGKDDTDLLAEFNPLKADYMGL